MNIQYEQGKTFKIPNSNGRTLGYNIYGNETNYNRTILFFHGCPGSRFELYTPFDSNSVEFYQSNGIRIICIERPGYGLTSNNYNSTHISNAEDILQLIKHLQLKEFSIIGFSSAGGLVHSLIYLLNTNKDYSTLRIISATLISCQGPIHQYSTELRRIKAKKTGWFTVMQYVRKYRLWWLVYLQQYYNQLQFFLNPKQFAKKFYGKRLFLDNKQLEQQLITNLASIYIQSDNLPSAVVNEFQVAFKPWPFSLSTDYSTPSHPISYSFWHGKRDVMRPVEVSQWQANCVREYKSTSIVKEHYLDGVGHAVHLYWEHWKNMLEETIQFN